MFGLQTARAGSAAGYWRSRNLSSRRQTLPAAGARATHRCAVAAPADELLAFEEEIVDGIAFARARRARGGRNRVQQTLMTGLESLDKGVFTGS